MPKLIFTKTPNPDKEWEYIKLNYVEGKFDGIPEHLSNQAKENGVDSIEKEIKRLIIEKWNPEEYLPIIDAIENEWKPIEKDYFDLVAQVTETLWKNETYYVVVSSIFPTGKSNYTKPYGDDCCICIEMLKRRPICIPRYTVGHELIHTHYWRFKTEIENGDILKQREINELTNFFIQFKSPLAPLFPNIDFTGLVLGKKIPIELYNPLLLAWVTRKSFKGYVEQAIKIGEEYYREA